MGESKDLQYFGNMRHSLVTLDTFVKVMKVITTLDCKIPSSLVTLQVLLIGCALWLGVLSRNPQF